MTEDNEHAAEKQRAHNLEELIHEVVSKPFSLEQIGMIVAKALDQDEN